MSDQARDALHAALLRERLGYETRLGAALEELDVGVEDEDREKYLRRIVADNEGSIADVNASLKAEGFEKTR